MHDGIQKIEFKDFKISTPRRSEFSLEDFLVLPILGLLPLKETLLKAVNDTSNYPGLSKEKLGFLFSERIKGRTCSPYEQVAREFVENLWPISNEIQSNKWEIWCKNKVFLNELVNAATLVFLYATSSKPKNKISWSWDNSPDGYYEVLSKYYSDIAEDCLLSRQLPSGLYDKAREVEVLYSKKQSANEKREPFLVATSLHPIPDFKRKRETPLGFIRKEYFAYFSFITKGYSRF